MGNAADCPADRQTLKGGVTGGTICQNDQGADETCATATALHQDQCCAAIANGCHAVFGANAADCPADRQTLKEGVTGGTLCQNDQGADETCATATALHQDQCCAAIANGCHAIFGANAADCPA